MDRLAGILGDFQVVSGVGRTTGLRALDLLGEIRLLCRFLGSDHHRLDRLDSMVSRAFHLHSAGLVHKCSHHYSLGRSPSGGRIYFYRAFFQHSFPSGKIPHGHGDIHGPSSSGGAEIGPSPGISRTGTNRRTGATLGGSLAAGGSEGDEVFWLDSALFRTDSNTFDYLGGDLRLPLRQIRFN